MEKYKEDLSLTLAETGALFFGKNLVLKDGRPTPYFVNLGSFNTGSLSLKLGSFFADMFMAGSLEKKTDIIVGPSYKGSSIAIATVNALFHNHGLDFLFDYDRKEAKKHGEMSSSATLFVNNTFFDRSRIFIVDDVATSMDTKYELIEKIKKEFQSRGFQCTISGLGIAVDREQTAAVYGNDGKIMLNKKGEDAVALFSARVGVPFFSVAGIREIVGFLYANEIPVSISGEKRPIDDKLIKEFNEYMIIYGRE